MPKTSHASLTAGREYSKADSRYASRDPFVVSMEAITAFVEGPLCFLAVWGLFRRSSWRYTIIIIVSLGQLYGDVLYFATTILEGGLPWPSTCYLGRGCSVSCTHKLNHAASQSNPPAVVQSRPDHPSCLPAGCPHSRPEFLYLWFYFAFINSIWIVVPALCIAFSAVRISSVLSQHEAVKQR